MSGYYDPPSAQDVPPTGMPAEWERWRGQVNERLSSLTAAVVASSRQLEAHAVEMRSETKTLRRMLWMSSALSGAVAGTISAFFVHNLFYR